MEQHHLLSEEELTFPFSETGYCCRTLDPFTSTDHSHDFYELTYCVAGAPIHVINDKPYAFPENSIFIVRPNDTHYFTDFHSATALTICINSAKFEAFLKVFSLENEPCFLAGNEPFFLELPKSEVPYFRNLYGHIMMSEPLERTPYFKLFLSRTLSYKIQQALDKRPVPNEFLKAISEMEKLENAREGVAAFLRLTNFSHAHLCRLSKQYLHMTPHEYVNNIRLQYAHSMIIEESTGYDEVAELVGFSSYPHFCKLFQETYHISPSKLRNQRAIKKK